MAEQRLLPTHGIHLAPFHSKLPFHALQGPTHGLTNPGQMSRHVFPIPSI